VRRPVRLWALDLGATPAPVDEPGIFATYARLGNEDVPEIAKAMDLPDLAEVLQRFAAGRRCYVARVGLAIAAYGWVTFDQEWIGEMRSRISLLPGEAYIWNCETLVEYRRQRLFSRLLAHIVNDLRSEGWSRAWIGAVCDDVISPRGIAAAGFEPVADLQVAWALGVQLTWVRGVPPARESFVDSVRQSTLKHRSRAWMFARASGKTLELEER
jgi:hypothetical protein